VDVDQPSLLVAQLNLNVLLQVLNTMEDNGADAEIQIMSLTLHLSLADEFALIFLAGIQLIQQDVFAGLDMFKTLLSTFSDADLQLLPLVLHCK
jgi:hypothetical protein